MTRLLATLLLAACGASPSPVPAEPAPVASASPAPTPTPPPAASEGNRLVQPAQVSREGGWQHFGTSFTLAEDQTLACEALLAEPGRYLDQTVRIRGRVAEVCQDKGCWMVVTPLPAQAGQPTIRVTMKDEAFSVDKQGAGRETTLEGVLVKKPLAPQGEGYELVASAVEIRNDG